MAKKAVTIPCDENEERYVKLLSSKTGRSAEPFWVALTSLLVQKQIRVSDRELIKELMENPYFQYFVGLFGYQSEPLFVLSLLVEFRK